MLPHSVHSSKYVTLQFLVHVNASHTDLYWCTIVW